MSIYTPTLTATPRPRSESAFMLPGTGNGPSNVAFQARWAAPGSHVEGMYSLGKTSADIQPNPIVTRDRVVAAKQGSPPRGVPR